MIQVLANLPISSYLMFGTLTPLNKKILSEPPQAELMPDQIYFVAYLFKKVRILMYPAFYSPDKNIRDAARTKIQG